MNSLINWKNIKNIIFDLDGVLVESEHLHARAKVETLAHYNIILNQAELQKRFTGISDTEFWISIKNEYPQIEKSIPELTNQKKEIYKTMAGGIHSIPGSVDFLNWAKENGRRLGVVTSSDDFYQGIAFDFLKIHSTIDLLINADRVTNYKPHPEPYLKMRALLGESADSSFVIEDSPSGIKSAKAAGFFVVGLTTSFTSEALKNAGADMTANGYEELKKHLK